MKPNPCRHCARRAQPGGCPRSLARVVVVAGVGAVVPLAAGCGAAPRPVDASPIVAADSEAGRKAIAESAELLQLRQRQEAASRRKLVAPPEG